MAAKPKVKIKKSHLVDKAAYKKDVENYFRSGDPFKKTLADWQPRINSADVDLNKYRDKMVARARDLIRNNGYAQSIVYAYIDNVIGYFFKIQPKPSHELLNRDWEWRENVATGIKARFNAWANSAYYYADYYSELTFVEILKQALFSYLTTGESLVIIRYKGGAGRYRLKLQVIEPERLSTPDSKRSDPNIIDGVKVDGEGRVLGYYICNKHPSDSGVKTWNYVRRYNTAGRKQVIHLFDKERPGQKRGRSLFAPIIEQFKLLDDYKGTENERAIAQAMFAAVIQSDMPSEAAFMALGGELDHEHEGLGNTAFEYNMQCRADFRGASGGLTIGGSKIAHLATNEKLNLLRSDSPNTAYAQFVDANVRELAAGAGASFEQVSKDYSRTSYASARTSMLEAWKRFMSMRKQCPEKLANEVYSLWIEEDLEVVTGYPDSSVARFSDFPAAWTSAEWIAPGKGEIDPLKQAQASRENLANYRTTHQDEAADIGKDFDDILDQRASEEKKMRDRGIMPQPQPAIEVLDDEQD